MGKTILVDDPVVAKALPRLARAAALGHSKRSFLEHLLGTWRILADWRMPVAVCRAGFLHSAYATSFYPHALFGVDQRETVRRLIGREAEALAFRFCSMDRAGFWDELARRPRARRFAYHDRRHSGARISVTRNTLGRLLIIDSANIAEQSAAPDGGPAPWMSRVLRWWQFLDDRSIPVQLGVRPQLTQRADETAIDAYRQALDAPVRQAAVLLDRAIRHNPWAGEPRILKALCALEMGDAALDDANKGSALLSAWAVPWDKRLSLNAWHALCGRIERASRRPTAAPLSFSSISEILSAEAPKRRWLRV